ncbi:MAG: copper homeostasis protein CutC, partial [Eudoraea sp.]|uniref:copper homeostasis protein CutC n=1 Tax=Eudoraea sp. TaxID=1979955 RepID=UPI003C779E6F
LCAELAVGGITPSFGLIKKVSEKLSIPIHVLIRPRSGDFTYSREEFEIMKTNIVLCADLGVSGIVSGVLQSDGTLDKTRTRELISAGGDLKFTFHRAFDWVTDPIETLGELEDLGVDCILTSGGRQSAEAAINQLDLWRENATKCVIMPGGGIRVHNALLFKNKGFEAIHLSGLNFSKTLDKKPELSMNNAAYLRDDEIALTDPEIVRAVVQSVK